MSNDSNHSDALVIGGMTFRSRLMVGTGKYETPEDCVAALDASGVAMRLVEQSDVLERLVERAYDAHKWSAGLAVVAGSPAAEPARNYIIRNARKGILLI